MANRPNDPIVDYSHPSIIVDTILIERTSNKLGNYLPLEPGADYPKETHSVEQVRLFDNAIFLGQKATDNQEWMQMIWGKEPSTQDIANWEQSFASESNAHPSFQRRYLEKRDLYSTLIRTKGTPLQGLYAIYVTAAGAGYTSAPAVSFAGGGGGGATAIAVLNNAGGVAKIVIKTEGTYSGVPPGVGISGGGGAGATAVAVCQADACVLVEEKATDNAPAPYNSLYLLVSRVYMTMPGPILTSHLRSSEIRGKNVDVTEQDGLTGTLPVESGGFIISSKTSPLSTVLEKRVTEKVEAFPPNEIWYDYQYADIPRRIFDLVPTVICNGTDQYAVVFNPNTKPAGSFIRKHRTTIEYSATPPGDTALNIITRADLDYDGKIINHHYHGVLNDAITFTGTANWGGCTWTETYTFPASSPSASAFAGQWWLISRQTIPWGTSGWRTKTMEFFEPA